MTSNLNLFEFIVYIKKKIIYHLAQLVKSVYNPKKKLFNIIALTYLYFYYNFIALCCFDFKIQNKQHLCLYHLFFSKIFDTQIFPSIMNSIYVLCKI